MLFSSGDAVRIVPEGRARHAYLAMEFSVLFVVLPTLYMIFRPFSIHPLPVVLSFAALCIWILKRNGDFTLRDLWGAFPKRSSIRLVAARFGLFAVLIAFYVVLFEPKRLLAFPRDNPVFWFLFVLMYPVISVVPQGIIYRVFVFRRYRELFASKVSIIVASALAFSYAHIIYQNPMALIMTLGGGFFFAHTYARSDAPWFSHVEHALYGNFVFTIGLGYYIWTGAVR